MKLAKLRRYVRQAGQGMTEYIIIVALIAIGSIAVYSFFGDTLREQTSAAAMALSGQSGTTQTDNAQTAANKAAANTERELADFARDKQASD